MYKFYAEPFSLRRTLSRVRWLWGVMIFLVFFSRTYAQSQNLTVDLHDASLKEVMNTVKKQSGYSFLYQDDLIANYGRRDFHIDTNRIEAVMKVILSGTNLTYELEDNVIVLKREINRITTGTPVNVLTARGIIRDETGETLPGVSVVVKGTTRGTVSDHDGVYAIDIREDDILVFSFIGYMLVETPVDGRTTIDVVMQQEVSKLREVVVTGYQDVNKESFTGRAVTISGEDLIKTNPVNVFQSIQAYDPSFRIIENNLIGSNPNRLPDVNVRGATGLPSGLGQVDRSNLATNPNQPTFILDGFEVSMQTVYDMDINRIESVTLLKDAAATAIYGSRAANGVLVIKTKTPKEGALQVSYNYQLTASTPDLTVYDVLNAQEKLNYEYLAGVYDAVKNNQAMTQQEYDELYYQKKRLVLSGVDSYWLSEPVETSFGHKNSLTIEGGAKSIRYGVTAQMQTLPGVMKGSERTRYAGDMYLSYNLHDKFLFKNTLSVSQVSSKESPYGSFEDYVKMNPYYPKYDENGNVLRKLDEWTRVYTDAVTGSSNLRTQDAVLNPAYEATLSSFDKSRYTQLINSFSTNWNIREGLMLKGVISITRYLGTQDIYSSPLSNKFYYYSTSDYSKRGEYTFSQTDQTIVDGNLILSYNKQINRHMINASIGGNLKDNTSSQKSFTARGFTNDRFDNISFASSYYDNDSPQGLDEVDRLVGSIVAVNYSFDNRFLLDLSARLDGSSKFGTDKKYAPFWAAGIGWNLHHEKFLASVPAINQLRITATTGLTGGVSFPPYLGKTTYQYYNDWYSTGVGATTLGYGNNDLKWQRTQNYELGMNAIALDRRITISGSYYNRITHDLIADIATPPSVGFDSYKDNLGEMENKGYEFGIRVDVLRRREWTLTLNANMTHNRNTLKSIASSLQKYNADADAEQQTDEYRSVPLLRFYEGRSLETIYAVPSRGIDPENGREIYVKQDGTLTYTYDVRDVAPVGDKTPTLYGTLGGTLSYKNWMLFLTFYTNMGGDQFNQTLIDRVENANPRYNVDQRVLDQRWKKPGDHTFFKNIADTNPTMASSRFVQSNNYLELKTASLTYDAPASWKNRLRMQMLRIVLTANDPWRWSSVKMERGIDYPFARTFTLSVQTRF